eukprot:1155956-Pelagomonas_calceolata.AAC.3
MAPVSVLSLYKGRVPTTRSSYKSGPIDTFYPSRLCVPVSSTEKVRMTSTRHAGADPPATHQRKSAVMKEETAFRTSAKSPKVLDAMNHPLKAMNLEFAAPDLSIGCSVAPLSCKGQTLHYQQYVPAYLSSP